jgi:hypothetical protein
MLPALSQSFMATPTQRLPSGFISRVKFPALWSVPGPPASLFYEGHPESLRLLANLPDRGLAIVGTRDPMDQTVRDLTRWVERLATSKLIIISGFARGIDQAAHSAALKAGLPTVAILGAGLNRDYPDGSGSLRRRIVEAGGLISFRISREQLAVCKSLPSAQSTDRRLVQSRVGRGGGRKVRNFEHRALGA